MIVELGWVDDVFLGQEALRHGKTTPPFYRLAGAAASAPLDGGSVLCGLITETGLQKYTQIVGCAA